MKLLITHAEVAAHTALQLNAQEQAVRIGTPLAQLQHLRPVLGNPLFGELLAFMQAETPDVADPLAALAEELKAMLAWWVVVEAWPHMQLHLTNAGPVTKVGRNADGGVNRAEVELLSTTNDANRRTASFYADELRRWLVERADQYPSFVPPGGAAPATSMPLGGYEPNCS